MIQTAIVLIVFNRPGVTAQVFTRIKSARPAKLYIIADGPRPNRPDDRLNCSDVRRIIDQGIDWPCMVRKNYSDINLGCAKRVSSGLDWAFSLEDRLIVLEDDCLPDESFFRFCEELLEQYANDERVGQICGGSRYFEKIPVGTSYVFSRYGPIWGWASWRRVWSHYDLGIKSWPNVKKTGLLRLAVVNDEEYKIRSKLYDSLYAANATTWDFQWGYAKLINQYLSILPNVNLVKNIGIDIDPTHGRQRVADSITAFSMPFPLKHPELIAVNEQFDNMYSATFSAPHRLSLFKRIINKFIKI